MAIERPVLNLQDAANGQLDSRAELGAAHNPRGYQVVAELVALGSIGNISMCLFFFEYLNAGSQFTAD